MQGVLGVTACSTFPGGGPGASARERITWTLKAGLCCGNAHPRSSQAVTVASPAGWGCYGHVGRCSTPSRPIPAQPTHWGSWMRTDLGSGLCVGLSESLLRKKQP